MQPPLPLGTVLQNRYRLAKILGQGGFGRTYLAEDQGRFNEPCALKELIPQKTPAYPLEKSKELFQREAAILYQIQHPQIPQFRAIFEQNDRLFLVQEYVEGKTYRTLLNERKALGQRFSEAEVLQLLQQLLPVLHYIHGQGIIHRDISPDNIILREKENSTRTSPERLPILIDFGVVKEIATRFQYPDRLPPNTMVGKLGYAPSEQIQTGRAYPSSDLYSLAVTAVVLLTGQEPQVLFDETTLNWNWYRWIPPIHPGLTEVLNRMLSYKPGDRYQDAREAARALSESLNPQYQSYKASQVNQPQPDLSQIQTLAIGHPPEPKKGVPAATRSEQRLPGKTPVSPAKTEVVAIPSHSNPSLSENPWAIAFIGVILAILTGFGSWALVSYLLKRQPLLPAAVTKTPSPESTLVFPEPDKPLPINLESPTPTPSQEPTTYSQRLTLVAGEPFSVSDKLKANATVNYIISAQQGQKLKATLEKEGVLMTVLGPNEEPVDRQARRVSSWEGELPFSGNYTIELRTVTGVAENEYNLDLRLSNPESTPTPTPTPTETLTPTPTPSETPTETTPSPTPTDSPAANIVIDTEPVDFPEGATGTQLFAGEIAPQNIKRYLVNVQEGQILSARIQTGDATLDIRLPDGDLIDNAFGLGEWEAKLTETGEYQIDVKSAKKTKFSVEISLKD